MNIKVTAAAVAETDAALPVCYDRLTIQLHWASAILIALLWGIAQIIDFFPKGAPRIAVRSVHILLGVLLAVVLLIRVAWRSRSGRRLPLANDGIAGHIASIAHLALYAGLASVIGLGMLNAWARGDSIFGLLRLPGNAHLKPTVEDLHGTFANALVILAAAHALVAVVHHFILRDGVLRRMLPGIRARGKGR
jgi:cytochrome b561